MTSRVSMRKPVICVSGVPSVAATCPPEVLELARELGKELARAGVHVATTTTTGFPLWVAMAAGRAGARVTGFSPAANEHEHTTVFNLPVDTFELMVYTGFGTSGSSMMALRSSHAIVFGHGGMTSTIECTMAVREGKWVGILESDEWSTDEVLNRMLRENYPEYDRVLRDTDPVRLVNRLVKRVRVG